MATEAPAAEQEASTGLSLDPFSFQPGVASRITGLGGSDPGYNPDYVFHTQYVGVAPGYAHFHVRFRGLAARQGTLIIRVHMVAEEGAHARLVTAERVLLSRLIQLGGNYAIRFEAFHGISYALYGGIQGDTDAEAEGLEIVLDRPADPNAQSRLATEGRNTRFGHDKVKPATHLVSLDRPRFDFPVTQLCTQPQLRERAFGEAVRRLGQARAEALDRWRQGYVLQALTSYGVLQAGARGLCFNARGALPATIADAGVELVAISEGDSPDVAAAGSHPGLSYRTAAFHPLPDDLVNYDFLWSDDVLCSFATAAESQQFAEEAMACLRPGGFAVHVVRYDPSDGHGGVGALQRADIERLLLIMISRKHEVAMFKVHREDIVLEPSRSPADPDITACGIILRRAPTIQ